VWSSEWSKRQVWPQGRLSFQSVGRRKALSGNATAIPHSTVHNKRHGQRFGLPCLAYSVLTRAGRGSFVLDFLCYFLVSRQESRGKKIVAEAMMESSFILTPPWRAPLSLERRGDGGEVQKGQRQGVKLKSR